MAGVLNVAVLAGLRRLDAGARSRLLRARVGLSHADQVDLEYYGRPHLWHGKTTQLRYGARCRAPKLDTGIELIMPRSLSEYFCAPRIRSLGQPTRVAKIRRHSSQTERQQGQAIIEFLVAALVLIPLFLLMPLIGKYLDIKQATIAASRKLAFECTVRYADCTNLSANPSFADEVRMRFFSGDVTPVLSNDYPAADAIQPGQGNHLWVDNQGRPLLENYSDVGIEADAKDINVAGGVVNGLLNTGPQAFGLNLQQGLFDARVQTDLSRKNGGSDFLTQLNSLVLKMQFHTAILTNAWTADGPGVQGDKCQPNKNTVIGRASQVSLCMAPYQAADAAYQPALDFALPLAASMESNTGQFHFHDFMDTAWVEDVPTNDAVGYSRLQ